jgi:predicted nucleic acid-binding protein
VIVYCDSNVLLKRVLDEPDSLTFCAVINELLAGGASLATSAVGRLEVSRVIRRSVGQHYDREVELVLDDIAIVGISDLVLRNAADVPHQTLRSLDAIHVATAFTVGADLVLTLDKQMRAACEELGMLVGP